jgi:hypothetical protein
VLFQRVGPISGRNPRPDNVAAACAPPTLCSELAGDTNRTPVARLKPAPHTSKGPAPLKAYARR